MDIDFSPFGCRTSFRVKIKHELHSTRIYDLLFMPTRYVSVGCDDGAFKVPKYRIDAPQNECEITKKEVSLLALSK